MISDYEGHQRCLWNTFNQNIYVHANLCISRKTLPVSWSKCNSPLTCNLQQVLVHKVYFVLNTTTFYAQSQHEVSEDSFPFCCTLMGISNYSYHSTILRTEFLIADVLCGWLNMCLNLYHLKILILYGKQVYNCGSNNYISIFYLHFTVWDKMHTGP
jgi:hypothetical protein